MVGKRVGILAVIIFSAAPVLAEETSSAWVASSKSQARLVAGGPGEAGLEIRLAPGALTYWRDPGEAGVPPTFDFSGSTNLAKAEPLFPAPARVVESDGSEAFGYEKSVVFPLRVTPLDPGKPIGLQLHLSYAVCEKICLPARADLTLALAPGGVAANHDVLAAATARTPKTEAPAALGIEASAAGAGAWRVCLPEAPGRDLFVEAPEGYWIAVTKAEASAGRQCFALKQVQAPAGSQAPPTVRATFSGESPVETAIKLPSP